MKKMMGKFKTGTNILLKDGPLTLFHLLKERYKNKRFVNPYDVWIRNNEQKEVQINVMDYNPLISILVPVYNVKDYQLIDCIESVKKQSYSNWELCLADDASTWDSVRKVLKKYENEPNFKIVYRQENGHISRATNSALEVAMGEFVSLLDCDDTLAPNALYEMVKMLNENPEYDFIYSDEDKISEDGKKRHTPFFKPDWSPDTLMSLMYTCHFSMFRKKIVDMIGGMRVGYEGAQDYDFVLRFTEYTDKIGHVPKILYHWRERNESTSLNPQSKPYIFEATRKAKEDAIKRRGYCAELEFLKEINQYRIRYKNSTEPKVSIIIPSKNNYKILKQCIDSIINHTTYKNYEIIVVDNGSNKENKQKYSQLCKQNNYIYHYEEMNFNFSKMCNIGSRLSSGDFLLFLNDDIEIATKEWIDLLVGHASLLHIGAVGAKLYYPNSNKIQHIGITNLKVGPSHSQVGYSDDSQYYFCRNKIEYNYIAVTGACLIVQKDKYLSVNGFDEELPIAYNDVDLCFKLLNKGYYNVVRNDVVLFHHESLSRGNDNEDIEKRMRLKKELEKLYENHPQFKGKDPYYNKNLTQRNIDYSLDVFIEQKQNKIKEINSFSLEKYDTDKAHGFIDSIILGDCIRIEGWAFCKKSLVPNLDIKKVLLMSSNGNTIEVSTNKVFRPDVTNAFGNKKNLNLSGFSCEFDKKLLQNTNYNILILFNNIIGKPKYAFKLNRIVEENNIKL